MDRRQKILNLIQAGGRTPADVLKNLNLAGHLGAQDRRMLLRILSDGTATLRVDGTIELVPAPASSNQAIEA